MGFFHLFYLSPVKKKRPVSLTFCLVQQGPGAFLGGEVHTEPLTYVQEYRVEVLGLGVTVTGGVTCDWRQKLRRGARPRGLSRLLRWEGVGLNKGQAECEGDGRMRCGGLRGG